MTLKELIKEKGYTQERLAEEIGCTQSAIANWCNGFCGMKLTNLWKIAEALGVTMDDIYNAIDGKGEDHAEC